MMYVKNHKNASTCFISKKLVSVRDKYLHHNTVAIGRLCDQQLKYMYLRHFTLPKKAQSGFPAAQDGRLSKFHYIDQWQVGRARNADPEGNFCASIRDAGFAQSLQSPSVVRRSQGQSRKDNRKHTGTCRIRRTNREAAMPYQHLRKYI